MFSDTYIIYSQFILYILIQDIQDIFADNIDNFRATYYLTEKVHQIQNINKTNNFTLNLNLT